MKPTGRDALTFTILVTAPSLAPAGRAELDAAGCRTIFVPTTLTADDLAALLRTEPVDAIISRTRPLTADMIGGCPCLKVISRHGVGYDIVDLPTATRRGIPVLVTPATNGQSVAEMAIGLMLAVARDIPGQNAAIRRGEWSRTAQGRQLSGLTLGIVGFGGIGRVVAAVAAALGMTVVAFDPVKPPAAAPGLTVAPSLNDLLCQTDVLSLHCPLTPENRHLIGAPELALLRPGALLINTARGGLVDERALAEALATGRIAGAGLDTLESEPPLPDHPLRRFPTVVMTPHAGGSTGAALDATAAAAARHALLVLRGDIVPPAICVNPSVLPEEKTA